MLHLDHGVVATTAGGVVSDVMVTLIVAELVFPAASKATANMLYLPAATFDIVAITEDVVNILKVEKKDVIVVVQEASHGNWYASGIRL